MEILLSLALICFFIFLIMKLKFFRRLGIKTRVLALVFLLKVLTGVGVSFIYTHYYEPWTADMYKYFQGGRVLYSALEESPSDYFKMLTGIRADEPQLTKYYVNSDYWYKKYNYGLFNDNRTMIRYNALLCLVSQGNYFVNLVITIFLSFTGAFLLAVGLLKCLPRRNLLIFIGVFLVPTVLFWSSGLLKESLVMFSMGAMLYFLILLNEKLRLIFVLFFILAAILLFYAKFYVLLSLMPGLVFLILSRDKTYWRPLLVMAVVVSACLVLFFNSKALTGLNFASIITEKQNDFVKFVNLAEDAGSNVELSAIEPTPKGILRHLPMAYYHSFMRPHIFEGGSVFSLMAAVENLAVVLLVLSLFFFFRKPSKSEFRMILFSMSFVLLLYALIGLTTPNLGALVRYKMPAIPFLIISICLCLDIKKMPSLLGKGIMYINGKILEK